MPIVSNTSPILNLSNIGKLALLNKQFGEVIIPPAVLEELKLDSQFPGVNKIQKALDQGWMQVSLLEKSDVSQVLSGELDLGEAQAIALALEIGSPMILMDEYEGRQAAKSVGLSPIGILGVILREKKSNQEFSVTQTMDDLRHKAGFYLTEKLTQRILALAGE
jgi:predicted nucleic acid-binding protein